MLHLNLLESNKRVKLERLVKFLFTKNILEIVLLFVTLIALTLVWAWLTVRDQSKTVMSAAPQNAEYTGYSTEVEKINARARSVAQAGMGYTSTTEKIFSLMNQLPPDIRLNSLNFDRKNNRLTLAGVAATRTALLNLQELLHTVSWIDKSSAPTSQLFTASDVVFEIKSTLKNFPSLRPDTSTSAPRAATSED
jgi:Tfp pilus assembly protein PilN